MYSWSSRCIRNGIQARPDFDPDHRQLGEALAHAVDHPVGQVQDVVEGEAERVHGEEAVACAEHRLVPVRAGMECQRQPALLQRAVEPHIGVIVHLQIAHRGDHEPGHALAAAEGLDLPNACLRIRERQAQHGVHAAARLGQHLFGDPAVVGPAEIDLHLLLGMHADIEHAGREQTGIVDTHRVHPALAELHVASIRSGRSSRSAAADSASHVRPCPE